MHGALFTTRCILITLTPKRSINYHLSFFKKKITKTQQTIYTDYELVAQTPTFVCTSFDECIYSKLSPMWRDRKSAAYYLGYAKNTQGPGMIFKSQPRHPKSPFPSRTTNDQDEGPPGHPWFPRGRGPLIATLTPTAKHQPSSSSSQSLWNPFSPSGIRNMTSHWKAMLLFRTSPLSFVIFSINSLTHSPAHTSSNYTISIHSSVVTLLEFHKDSSQYFCYIFV